MNQLEYAALHSRWAPRPAAEKALLLLGVLVLVVALPFGYAWLLIAGVLTATVIAARPPLKLLLALVAAPIAFLVVGVLPLVVAITGDGLVLIDGGVRNAATLLLRSLLATWATVLYALTTPLPQTIALLHRLHIPGFIIELMVSMYRMVALLVATARSVFLAQQARLGYSSRRRWVASAASLGASLFVTSFARARRLAEGLELRADPQATLAAGGELGARGRAGFLCATLALLVCIAGIGASQEGMLW